MPGMGRSGAGFSSVINFRKGRRSWLAGLVLSLPTSLWVAECHAQKGGVAGATAPVVQQVPSTSALRAAVESLAPIQAPVEPPGPATSATTQLDQDPQRRAALFAQLNQEVAEFERFGRILRLVSQLIRPSVVHIEASGSVSAGADGRPASSVEEAGSGVIVEIRGRLYVITNRHVVRDSQPAAIHLGLYDGRTLSATSVISDRSTDVAVIGIAETDAVPAQLGNSDQIEMGDFVLAIGSPFGLSHSVTYGIISAKGRRDLELGNEGVRLQDFLQTDAAINPGNSGGPLVNLRGEVIGINTAIASSSGGSEGIGFTIPVNMVRYVAEQLVVHGAVTHAYLGVRLENSYGPEMARELGTQNIRGALVKAVTPDSPADRAQLQVNDLITHFNDTPVESDVHLVNLVGLTPVGQTVTLRIIRQGQSYDLQVEMTNRKSFEND